MITYTQISLSGDLVESPAAVDCSFQSWSLENQITSFDVTARKRSAFLNWNISFGIATVCFHRVTKSGNRVLKWPVLVDQSGRFVNRFSNLAGARA